MKSVLNGISTIIFDLGGVVLNLDPDRTARAFSKLSNIELENIYQLFQNNDWAPAFERGKISAETFRDQIRKELHNELTDLEIAGKYYCSLCFEAFPDDPASSAHFDKLVALLLNELKNPILETSHSLGYPGWLAELLQ